MVAAGASVSNADEKNLAGVPFVNYGEISGGTFAEILLYLENNGTITGGTFNCRVNNVNDAIITGGTFNEYLMNLGSVTDAAINGTIHNLSTITGCTFGESAWVEFNTGTIYVTMTVNGADATFKHGELILSALKAKFGEGDWYAVAGEEQEEISKDARFGLQKQAYACAHYTKDNTLYISAPTAVTEDMLADVKGVIVTATGEITRGTFTNSSIYMNVKAGGKISGGTFACAVSNDGAISGGTFESEVRSEGAISGGTFKGEVNNHEGGTISKGTFKGEVNNHEGCTISGGTFEGEVYNNKGGTISKGIFTNIVNNTGGTITGGTFTDAMVDNEGGTITGGVFDDFTMDSQSKELTITGAVDLDAEDALAPLTIALGGESIKSVTIAAGGSFDAGSTTVSAHVFNYGGIGGGTFREGTVYNRNGGVISAGTFDTTVYNQGSKIAGGTFNATVNNADGGEISGGTFGSGVYNKSSITGAITLTSEQSLINDGGDISGNITFTKEATLINDGGDISGNITFTEGEYLANSGKITGGAISGATVANRSGGIIFDGTFTDATVTNDGIIAYGDFRAAEVTNRDGSITGGIFKNCTLKDGELTITQNVDLREDADALAPLSLAADPFAKLEIASGCAFNAGDNTVSVYVINNGTITGGTFENSLLDNSGTISGGTFNNGDVLNNPGGTISGGAFSGCTYNFGAITGGTFAEIVLTGASARVQGVDGSVPTLNGPIENGMGGSILQPCNFGANASVVENRGVIEVPATVNNIPQSLRYGEKTLEQLKKINPNDVWFEQAADGTLKRVAESATVDLVSRTYVSRNLPAVEAPQAEIDFDGETLTVSLDTSSALPEGLQMGELDVLFTCGGKSGIVRDAFANGNSCTVTLSALGNALGLALPADNGSGDASLRVSLSAEGKEDGYTVRLAPMEADELSQAEKDATGAVETLTGSYRARVTAMIEGEEVDVTNAIPSLTAIFDAASVRELAGDEMAQLLLVPNDGEPETQVSTVQHIEETDTENARYEAPLMESGLFVMTLQ